MSTASNFSKLKTNLITAGLLTVFISAFGVFANNLAEQRVANCSISSIDHIVLDKCKEKEIYAGNNATKNNKDCLCPIAHLLAVVR